MDLRAGALFVDVSGLQVFLLLLYFNQALGD